MLSGVFIFYRRDMWDFFEQQKNSTEFKVAVLQRYLEKYFGIIIMQFWKLAIIDPFCWPWIYNDGKIWSPIAIMQVIEKYLSNEYLWTYKGYILNMQRLMIH